MSAFYSVTRRGCGPIIVRAKDPDAKQVLYGWGSDKRPSIEFYGRQVDSRAHPDHAVNEWQLSEDGLDELKRNLRDQLRRPKYFNVTPKENQRARALLKKLDKVSKPKSCKR